eukprot:4239389-Karenia_brevis.AAC.1
MEISGRWHPDALDFLSRLARCRARAAPALLRASAARAWSSRWSGLLALAAQKALAASLLHLPFFGWMD